MSASALKSTMPGVGTSPPGAAHSILPMSVMAQKVTAGGNESASIKPLSGGGLSYVTLQPANQPLSLVQDHRPVTYQNPSYASNNTEKEKDKETEVESKVLQNGVEFVKPTVEPEAVAPAPPLALQPAPAPALPPPKQQTDGNRNNNQSPENPAQDKQEESKPLPEVATPANSECPGTRPNATPKAEKARELPGVFETILAVESTERQDLKNAPICPLGPTKVEEKKTTPVKNGSKPDAGSPSTHVTKISPHKLEEQPQTRSSTDAAQQLKAKPIVQISSQSTVPSAKPSVECPTAVLPPKTEQKITSTPRTVKRKSRELKDLKGGSGEGGSKPKRHRVQTQPYQSPLPEIALIVKTLNKTPAPKNPDDKLIVFYKNEFLAVRNAEGSFYVCQAMQNIYKSSRRIRIRWLSQDKNNGEIYSPDFYDFTDFDCILTNLNLNKIDKNKFQLTKFELLRTENILKRAIDVEAGLSEKPRVTEEHPDGLDLSLYKDESQLKRRKRAAKEKQRLRKRSKRESSSSEDSSSSDEDTDKKPSPKSSRMKKRSMNKALAIAKSVAKGPNRAKRALNRAAASKPAAPPVGNNVTSSTVVEAAKRNAPETSKKVEPKKIINKPQSTNAPVPSRTTKLRGSAPESSNNSTAGRAKRVVTGALVIPTTGTLSHTEDSSSRKKPRTTRA